MKIRPLAIVAMALFLPIAAASCSDDSTGDLKVGDMSKEIQKSGIPKEQADCVAKALKDADFTEDDLKELGKDPNSAKYKDYIQAGVKCLSGASTTTPGS